MSYTKLLPLLIQSEWVIPTFFEPLTLPFPKWYNLDAHCECHGEILGHAIEDCALFKDEVQRLIQVGVLSFAVEEQLIGEVTEEDIAITITTHDFHVDDSENTIECSVQ
ncbi:hypothetical protein CRYUN_Cryun38cG0002800 [Craigia yunnanensis]